MLPFALTIFTGAFLLFQVQPLIGKYILPWFGGGPGVWTTCLLFFQTVLLAGYAYAHFSSTYLKPRTQAIVHLVLLALSLAVLPITPSEHWKTAIAGDPNWRILVLLMVTIGLPYFVLSSTGPLMQQWFSQTNPGVSPYRLYALSNVGSLLALLSYPAYFEVKFTRHTQANMWSAGLGLFVIFCGYCAYRLWQNAKNPVVRRTVPADPFAVSAPRPASDTTPPVDKLLWISLPAIASVLLLATTNKLSQEVAVIPFLWVLPLSLYLLTFIICFDHARWYHRGVFTALLVVGIGLVCQMLPAGGDAPMRLQIIGYTATLFVACMVCHGELYRLKPPPERLTQYFLFISAGGALGGFLVAIVAPAIFSDYRELQLGYWMLTYGLGVLAFRHRSRELVLGAGAGVLLLTIALPWVGSFFDDSGGFVAELKSLFHDRWMYIVGAVLILIACTVDFRRRNLAADFRPRMGGFVMAICVAVGAVFVVQWNSRESVRVLSATRNFYGTLKVFDYYPNDEEDHYHLLLHGATTHGLQFVKPEKSVLATTYYAESSGVGLAINHLPDAPRRLGLVGLGTGSLAVYGRKGDYLRIYEINPAVQTLARTQFKYLDYCQAKLDVVMGDARLMMEHEVADGGSQKFDLLALDAFSSDAIPVHLLTKEAFEIYLKQIKDDGVIAVHISNRYLNLRPVVEKLAEHFKLEVVSISDDNEPEWWIYATTWMLVTKNKTFLENEKIRTAAEPAETGNQARPLWTDDFASLYSIMK
jgi:spermidine synthase